MAFAILVLKKYMQQKDEMTTLSEVMEKMRQKKIDSEFRMDKGQFTAGKGKTYTPEELTIIKTFRFEGDSDPSDSSILYIIEAADGLQGYSLDAYGVYSDHDEEEGYDNFIRQIKVSEREDQLNFEL
jgi:hypothetical protein